MGNDALLASLIKLKGGDPVLAENAITGFHCNFDDLQFDQWFLSLPSSASVAYIDAISTSITDDSLASLTKYPNLVELFLENTNVTLKTLPLTTAKNLKKLFLSECLNIDDSSLSVIANCISLEKLTLYKTSISNAGLKYVASLKSLVYLEIGETKIGDPGLEFLRDMPRLRKLGLTNTLATEKGFAELMQRLPGLIPNMTM